MKVLAATGFFDVFKKSFLESTASSLSVSMILAIMLSSLVIGAYIYLIYRFCYVGVVYSHNFNISVAMMCVITAMIVSTISSNVTLSLGMVGALSIIRFRSAIKDPIDLIFLFWAVAAGISVGARLWYMALIGNLFVGVIFILLTKLKHRKKTYLLVIRYTDDASAGLAEATDGMRYTLRSRVARGGVNEATLEIKVKAEGDARVDAIKSVAGVESVTLISYNGDFAQ